MIFNSYDALKTEGFMGFRNIKDLFLNCSDVPNERGNYLVLYLGGDHPKFVPKGVGGFFKGKDPNRPIVELEKHWVPGTIVVYIGQAGGVIKGKWSEQTLNDRISTYMKFGREKPVAHWGGRYIWQIQNYKDLVLCWKPLHDKVRDPKLCEHEMITEFKTQYDGKRPFANCIG